MQHDEPFGIGPCIIHDLPAIKADNERKQLLIVEAERSQYGSIELRPVHLKPGTRLSADMSDSEQGCD